MTNSERIGELLGPTLMVMAASEFPLMQPYLYDEQIPPVVYLSGVFMFVAGLAIARSHNLWQRDWTLLITICGWFLLALGLFRMFAASFYRLATGNTDSLFFMIVECILFSIGSVITWKAYTRDAKS